MLTYNEVQSIIHPKKAFVSNLDNNRELGYQLQTRL